METSKGTLGIFFLLLSLYSCGHHENYHEHDTGVPREEKKTAASHGHRHETKEHTEKETGHDHGKMNDSEPGAVLKAEEKKGIKIRREALATIGVKELPLKKFKVSKRNAYRVPNSALVRFETNTGCYLKRNDWFREIRIRVLKRGRTHTLIALPGRLRGDSLVVSGASLMRLTWLEAFGASGHGHGH